MAASKIIVSENIEVPVVDGKIQCIRCKGWKLPDEMHFKDRTCQACYETIRARNQGKPKPKENSRKIIKRNGMGWVERVEKPRRVVGDSELAKMIILERAADNSISPEPITSDGISVLETNNQPTNNDSLKPIIEGGIIVSETTSNIVSETEAQSAKFPLKTEAFDGITVSDTKNNCADNDYSKPIAKNGITVSDTKNNCADNDYSKPIAKNGITVSDTDPQLVDDVQKDAPATIPITEDGIRVSGTAGNIVSETKSQSIICDPKPKTNDGIRVSDTRLTELERALGIANESIANALRRIRALEEKLEKLSPVIEKEEAKRDAAGLQKLRDDLFKLLRERMEKSHTNGIYVHSLYGKNGRRGGKLNISKMQAFRLRDACRGDDRFRVEKTENQKGNWAILLNIHMN